MFMNTRASLIETLEMPRLSRNKARDVHSPASRNRRLGPRRSTGRRRGGGGSAEEAEDFEMRDVRRDGLIEALLIAFTPPRGLPYPRVYPRFVTLYPPSPAQPHVSGLILVVNARTPLLPSFLYLRPSSPSFLPALYNFSPFSSRLASRTFRLHSM